ncbi:hypothetical protein [Secundilactobacillus silagei]|uniref:Uncharacterized protein n=1 Tax=Secundilactobacillus silagei JCM 19001 TaxID=1302250 RepID=A0A1Z5IKH0_9LACO|nr:hypothetical protein [Secundilactobacillus silagei]TDG68630.1 hypothetical protein C5L25_001706 [Secundilactobacillus silagei JCM 19001]GAX01921.1 hypothetical protein IWT126_01985 [Secundilactobacillus silagei JCM 19001]
MHLKKLVIIGITALSFGTGLVIAQPKATAATWHTSAIPTKLRGTWHGKYTGQKLYIYQHTIYYPSINKVTHVKWQYTGSHYYRFKGDFRENGTPGSFYGTTSLHYFNSHKITTMSMEHTFYR